MLEDLEQNPDRYEWPGADRLEELLGGLASGASKLTELSEEDGQLLSRATMEYATAPATQELAQTRRELVQKVRDVLKTSPPKPEAPTLEDVPDTDMPPFWWLQ